jgi:hypothetical protein
MIEIILYVQRPRADALGHISIRFPQNPIKPPRK